MPSSLLRHYKIVIKIFPSSQTDTEAKGGKLTMALAIATVKKHLFQAYTAVSGSSSAEEGCTDTNAYWEALLLRKAAQTPMLTVKLFC